jgi:hypothetical protein
MTDEEKQAFKEAYKKRHKEEKYRQYLQAKKIHEEAKRKYEKHQEQKQKRRKESSLGQKLDEEEKVG